jgi:hypothetical protein
MFPSKSDFELLDLTITSYCLTRFIFCWNDFFIVSFGNQGRSLKVIVLMDVLLEARSDTAPELRRRKPLSLHTSSEATPST